MEFVDYGRVIVRYRWLVIGGVVLGVVIAVLATILITPPSQARSDVYVTYVGDSDSSASDINSGNADPNNKVLSYLQLIYGPAVLEPVIRELGLDETVDELSNRILAATEYGTTVIEIVVTDQDPQRAMDVANAIAESFSDYVVETESPLIRAEIVRVATEVAPSYTNSIPINGGLGALIGATLAVMVACALTAMSARRARRSVETA